MVVPKKMFGVVKDCLRSFLEDGGGNVVFVGNVQIKKRASSKKIKEEKAKSECHKK